MEDLLVDQEQWVIVKLGTKQTRKLDEDWTKLDRKAQSTIRLFLEFVECVRRRHIKEVVGYIR